MPRRSNDFQKLIVFLEERLAGFGATVRESAMVAPLDGGEAVEVDVMIEAQVGHHRLRVAVECRDHARPASKEWINELAGKYAVLPIDKVVAVTRRGFTRGARQRAVGTKATLLTLQEANEADWPEVFHGWRLALVDIDAKPAAVRLTYHGESPNLKGRELFEAKVADATGHIVSTIAVDAHALYAAHAKRRLGEWWPRQPEIVRGSDDSTQWTVDLDFKAHERSVVGPDGRPYPIAELIIEVACEVRVRKPKPEFYEYDGAKLTTFQDAQDDGARTSFSLLHDHQTGHPKSLNVRRTVQTSGRDG